MSWKRASGIWVAVLAVAITLGFAGGAWASHKWGCWKYANYTINWYNGAAGVWGGYWSQETLTDSNSWHNYTDLAITQVFAHGATDHANCYAGAYGANGWLGLAQIVGYSGCTVKDGHAYLNTSYLNGYSTTARKHVACQEVGHLWGLNHNHSSNITCMNDWILSAPQPNSHDQALINSTY